MWAVPAGSPRAGCPAKGPRPAVGRSGGAEPCAAGQTQCDGRDVRVLDGLLPVQPGGDAVALTSNPARAAGTVSLTRQTEGRGDTVVLSLDCKSVCTPFVFYRDI